MTPSTGAAGRPVPAPGLRSSVGSCHRSRVSWYFGFSVKGFFDNGGKRLYVKRVVGADPASLCVADFVNALDAFGCFDAIPIVIAPGLWSAQVQAALIAQCEAHERCFAVLDAPADADVEQARTFRAQRHSRFAALYYPWVDVLDPRSELLGNVPVAATYLQDPAAAWEM